jgi:hypothetical protein
MEVINTGRVEELSKAAQLNLRKEFSGKDKLADVRREATGTGMLVQIVMRPLL